MVDDDPPLRRMLERTLAAEGFEVTVAADGGAALVAAERSAPDVIVLDVAMPGLDGRRGLQAAASQGPPDPDPDADRPRRRARSGRGARGGRRRLPGQAVRGAGADRAAARADPPNAASRAPSSPTLTWCSTSPHGSATRAGRPIELTGRESDLLELLLREPGRVVTRDQRDRGDLGRRRRAQRGRPLRDAAAPQARRAAADPHDQGSRVRAAGLRPWRRGRAVAVNLIRRSLRARLVLAAGGVDRRRGGAVRRRRGPARPARAAQLARQRAARSARSRSPSWRCLRPQS